MKSKLKSKFLNLGNLKLQYLNNTNYENKINVFDYSQDYHPHHFFGSH